MGLPQDDMEGLTCCCWLDSGQMIIGTKEGRLYLLDKNCEDP